MTDKPLAGKTAFVSGSGQNIGRAAAVRLAQLGCNVVVNGSSNADACAQTAALVQAEGAAALVAMGDMARAEDIARIATAARAQFGAVDIVVNNAARRPHKPFLETTDDDWDSVVGTLVSGADVTTDYEAKMDSEGFGGCA